jgi:aldose 1-epimerase
LPANDPAGKNAIHGFAAFRPWRVVDTSESDFEASVTGEFEPARDAPDIAELWPGEYCLRVTITRIFAWNRSAACRRGWE